MIKKIYLSVLFLAATSLTYGQIGKTKNIGKSEDFAKLINNIPVSSANSDRDASTLFTLVSPSGYNISCKVNLKTLDAGAIDIGGNAGENGSFSMSLISDNNVSGLYTSVKDKKAFK